jgi:hypothetical protein
MLAINKWIRQYQQTSSSPPVCGHVGSTDVVASAGPGGGPLSDDDLEGDGSPERAVADGIFNT